MKIESGLSGSLAPNPNWAKLPLFDRKGWKRLPFGAFAESVNQRVEPSDAADEIYVGLDDLDPQNLHIRRWGKGSDVIGTKLRFLKGDIIFGRRRAYQRKLAVAEFDGICSAHAMVVRAKPELVLPEFLPFLMMSDRFMNRAVEISVGSLSPTINWKALKLEKFDLPPLAQQRRIAEMHWAVDAVIERIQNVLSHTKHLLYARVNEAAESATALVSIGDIALSITSGSRGWAEYYSTSGAIFVRITNLQRNTVRLDWSDIQYVSPPLSMEATRTKIESNDVLVSITAELGLVAFSDDVPGEAYVNQHIAKVRINKDKYDPYLAAVFLSLPPCAGQFRKFNDQGAKAGMNLKNVAKLVLPDIAPRQQAKFVAEIRSAESVLDSLVVLSERTLKIRERLLSAVTEST